MGKRNVNFDIWWPERPESWGVLRRYLMPHPGTLIMTLLLMGGLLWAGSVGAIPLRAPAAATTSTGTIAYQGRLADSAGSPITDTVNMEFRLYDVPDGGTPLWSELWTGSNAVRVSDGLFNVMLGSLEPIPQDVVAGHDQLWLGITVGTDDEMAPRVQLGSVPFAVQALTVPDGSVSTAKLADDAVISAKIQDGQVTSGDVAFNYAGSSSKDGPASDVACSSCISSGEIQDGQVKNADLANNAVTTAKIRDNQVTDAKLASPIVTQWIELCFTSHTTCPGVVSNFSNDSMGGSRIWSGSFNFTPFDRGILSAVGRIYLADDTTHLADVPVAIWRENSDTARFSAILPDRYFNTVNSRLKVTLVGR